MIVEAISKGKRLQDEGWHGPYILQHIVRCRCRSLSGATVTGVMQALKT